MEWIEVTARSLDDARELALDRLGVVAEELEYEVLDEPRGGLFGLGRTDARIRARVKPLSREKPPDRRRRSNERGRGGANRKPRSESPSRGSGEGPPRGGSSSSATDAGRASSDARGPEGQPSRSRSRSRRGGRGGRGPGQRSTEERSPSRDRDDRPEEAVDADAEVMDVQAQADRAAEFTRELVTAMGLEGSVTSRVDEETVLVDVEGDGLGILVGPRGSTLQAVEELVRAVVQHGLSGRSARLRVDVGGYRERRREALAAFARNVAEEVRSANTERSLEPMSPPDRKVVHDAVAELDGVMTVSEGEEPRRRVVIRPA